MNYSGEGPFLTPNDNNEEKTIDELRKGTAYGIWKQPAFLILFIIKFSVVLFF